MNTKLLCVASVAIALVFLVTGLFQIPIPLGYFTLANCVILIFCSVLPVWYGVAVGSIASGLADLVFYPVYTLPTLVIKAVMPLVFYVFLASGQKSGRKIMIYLGAYVSMLIPLAGYTLAGMALYGGFEAGLAQTPGLIAEYIVNSVIFSLMAEPCRGIGKKLGL